MIEDTNYPKYDCYIDCCKTGCKDLYGQEHCKHCMRHACITCGEYFFNPDNLISCPKHSFGETKGLDYSKDNVFDALGRPDLKPKICCDGGNVGEQHFCTQAGEEVNREYQPRTENCMNCNNDFDVKFAGCFCPYCFIHGETEYNKGYDEAIRLSKNTVCKECYKAIERNT